MNARDLFDIAASLVVAAGLVLAFGLPRCELSAVALASSWFCFAMPMWGSR
jgi:hypothetical protein